MCSAIAWPKTLNRFGWNLEHSEYIVGAGLGTFWARSAQFSDSLEGRQKFVFFPLNKLVRWSSKMKLRVWAEWEALSEELCILASWFLKSGNSVLEDLRVKDSQSFEKRSIIEYIKKRFKGEQCSSWSYRDRHLHRRRCRAELRRPAAVWGSWTNKRFQVVDKVRRYLWLMLFVKFPVGISLHPHPPTQCQCQ